MVGFGEVAERNKTTGFFEDDNALTRTGFKNVQVTDVIAPA